MAERSFSFSLVFSPGGQAAADVALGFVQIQQLPHLAVQRRVDLHQPLGDVFMYGRFGNAELGGGCPDGGFILDDIHSQIAGALFDICMHIYHSPYSRVSCI